jgi:hypothetical protein
MLHVDEDEQDPIDVFGGPDGEERFERTRFALQRMGGASLGSATTTVGSSFFLLFCTLQVFTKLGTVVIAVTFLSILYALLPLPAILIYAGPLQPGIKPICEFLEDLPSRFYDCFCMSPDPDPPRSGAQNPRTDGQEKMLGNPVSSPPVSPPGSGLENPGRAPLPAPGSASSSRDPMGGLFVAMDSATSGGSAGRPGHANDPIR